MNKFMYGVSDLMRTECRNAMLLEDMNISRLITHAQQVEGDKLREHAKKNKKARIGNYDYSQQKLGGGNRLQLQQKSLSPASSSTSGGQRQNRLYALEAHHDQEDSPDVFTGMLRAFDLDIYGLLDPGATLSFVTPYIMVKFDVNLETLSKPFSVSALVGDLVIVRRVYINCRVTVFQKVTSVDLVELEMV
ncbi:hypothetical protein R3W88_031681 [Solanum pinnatisectum]|uniref:Gag-pol polyprotein n=1 Tax=Solanum pinnatisectum TaxID=50273 RepID=A0AAV9LNX5_9SOLN|nr:hypothetical protein R3W88_031681 [Solanum pinnatisectum]